MFLYALRNNLKKCMDVAQRQCVDYKTALILEKN